jgi:hypothetical protein
VSKRSTRRAAEAKIARDRAGGDPKRQQRALSDRHIASHPNHEELRLMDEEGAEIPDSVRRRFQGL